MPPPRPERSAIAESRAAGHDPGDPLAMSRRGSDGEEQLRWRVSKLPGEVLPCDGLVPFLIEWERDLHPALELEHTSELVEMSATHPQAGAVDVALRALGLILPMHRGEPRLYAAIRTARGVVRLS